jgi:hypothetical protein
VEFNTAGDTNDVCRDFGFAVPVSRLETGTDY